ncbi:MAG TPA: hypothetical protein VGI70_05160 [Polyangiales bacterium]
MHPPHQHPLWLTTTMLLFVSCSVVIWQTPAVPMQDYPQHLFIAAVLRGDPHHDWSQYEGSLSLAPYTGFYWFAEGATALLGSVDRAGRAFITAYFALLTLSLFRVRRRFEFGASALLLFYPLAINQTYFQGLLNYMITVPLLVLALHELRESAVAPARAPQLIGQAALLTLILWFHPFTVCVYLVLATIDVLLTRDSATRPAYRMLPALFIFALFYAWQSQHETDYSVHWWSLQDDASYLGQIASGMRPGMRALLLHGLGYVIVAALCAIRFRRNAIDRRDLFQALALALGYFALPFWIGRYSYFNVRLAPLLYCQIAILLASIPLPRSSATLVGAIAIALTIDACYLQLQVGREAAEILPLVHALKPEQRAVAIPFDDSSEYLDPKLFSQMHRHAVFYYQLLAGGVNPHLWRLPMVPLRYRSDVLYHEPHSIRELVEGGYVVIFARHPAPSFVAALERHYPRHVTHGAFMVFERAPSSP